MNTLFADRKWTAREIQSGGAVRDRRRSAPNLIKEGYEGFSMRILADRAGYSPAATYRHFKSRGEIFQRLADESFAALMQASADVKPIESEDPVSRMKRGMLAYVDFGLKNPDLYRIAFVLHRSDATEAPQPTPAFAGLKSRVEACIDAGKLRAENLELMAQSLWAAVHGITSLQHFPAGHPSRERDWRP